LVQIGIDRDFFKKNPYGINFPRHPGGFIDRNGPVTGYRRNGVTIIRTSTCKKDNIKTVRRLAQYEKVRLCNHFTRAFAGTDFLKRTFPPHGRSGSGYNRAMSALMHLAKQGTYPDLRHDYPSVLVSKGLLPGAANAHSERDGNNHIVFNWEDNSETGTARPDDKVILVAYFPELQQAVFSIGDTVRADGNATLDLHGMKSYQSHSWIGFLTTDEKDAAHSVYCRWV